MLILQTVDVFYCLAASIALNMNVCTESWWVITDVLVINQLAIPQISFQHLLNYIYVILFIRKANKSVPFSFHNKVKSDCY